MHTLLIQRGSQNVLKVECVIDLVMISTAAPTAFAAAAATAAAATTASEDGQRRGSLGLPEIRE